MNSNFKLSERAIISLRMLFQKVMLEEVDLDDQLSDLTLFIDDNGQVDVLNPQGGSDRDWETAFAEK